MAVGETDLEGI